MTASKAAGGVVAGHLVTLALWGLTEIPGWDSIPQEPQLAIAALVITGISWSCVYFAPANKPIAEPAPSSTRLLQVE